MPTTSKKNGLPVGPFKSLLRLADQHERKALVLREAAAVLTGHAEASARKRTAATLAAAVGHDAARRGGSVKNGKTPPGYGGKKAKEARRSVTAALLKHFDTEEARPSPKGAKGLGPLIKHGYLKRKGKNQFLRTAKAFA